MGRCSAMALAAARMAVADAGLCRRARRPAHRGRPRHHDGRGRRARASSITRGSSTGRRRVSARADPEVRLDAAAHPRRARASAPRAWCSPFPPPAPPATTPSASRADLIRAGRADVGGHRRRRDAPGASVQRLRPPRRDGAREVPALRPEPPGAHPRRGRRHPRPRVARRTRSARGARVLAEVGGHGLACDAYHITRPHPEGDGQHRRDARRRSSAPASRPTTIDFVNAHGTGHASTTTPPSRR